MPLFAKTDKTKEPDSKKRERYYQGQNNSQGLGSSPNFYSFLFAFPKRSGKIHALSAGL